ncbi:MAG: hypothetical protein KGL39_42510 [Patescibacteria group bacterium]|nr:hypothetical protein [Patescibacteria group bacterium]
MIQDNSICIDAIRFSQEIRLEPSDVLVLWYDPMDEESYRELRESCECASRVLERNILLVPWGHLRAEAKPYWRSFHEYAVASGAMRDLEFALRFRQHHDNEDHRRCALNLLDVAVKRLASVGFRIESYEATERLALRMLSDRYIDCGAMQKLKEAMECSGESLEQITKKLELLREARELLFESGYPQWIPEDPCDVRLQPNKT